MEIPLVIVGTGAAGYGLLRALRHLGDRRTICLLTTGEGEAYSKARFSSALGRGTDARDLVLATAEQMAHRFHAEVLTATRAVALDPQARRLRVAIAGGGVALSYAKLVLATGAAPLRPALQGTAADQVLLLGSLADYRYLRSELAGRRRVALLGGSAEACELAETLARSGCEVSLFESGDFLQKTVPTLTARHILRALGGAGVKVFPQNAIRRVDQGLDELDMTTVTGLRMAADVVLAVPDGAPRVDLAREAGLLVKSGIVVDDALRTSVAHVHALGACTQLRNRRIRLGDDIDALARVLAEHLVGRGGRSKWQPRMQRLHLEDCLLLLCEPPPIPGEWVETARPTGVKAVFHDRAGRLRGFALVGDTLDEADRLYRQLQP